MFIMFYKLPTLINHRFQYQVLPGLVEGVPCGVIPGKVGGVGFGKIGITGSGIFAGQFIFGSSPFLIGTTIQDDWIANFFVPLSNEAMLAQVTCEIAGPTVRNHPRFARPKENVSGTWALRRTQSVAPKARNNKSAILNNYILACQSPICCVRKCKAFKDYTTTTIVGAILPIYVIGAQPPKEIFPEGGNPEYPTKNIQRYIQIDKPQLTCVQVTLTRAQEAQILPLSQPDSDIIGNIIQVWRVVIQPIEISALKHLHVHVTLTSVLCLYEKGLIKKCT